MFVVGSAPLARMQTWGKNGDQGQWAQSDMEAYGEGWCKAHGVEQGCKFNINLSRVHWFKATPIVNVVRTWTSGTSCRNT